MRWTLAILLAGCNFSAQGLDVSSDARVSTPDATPDAPVVPDASVDAPRLPDARPDCEWEFSPTGFDPCKLPPTNGVGDEAGAATLDTETGMLTRSGGGTVMLSSALISQGGATALRVVVYDNLTIRAPLRVVGANPLLLVARGSIEVRGDFGAIDVSATDLATGGSTPGAGGNDPVACETGEGGAGRPPEDQGGASAGGGGGHSALGGHGGPGAGVLGGVEGGTSGTASLTPLRGGCAGGIGGSRGSASGAAGAGGGGLQLSAREKIEISGRAELRASGGGGGAATISSGGGGGGAGGGIFLEAAAVSLLPESEGTVRLCANGGSGGEGGGGPGAGGSSPGRGGVCSDGEAAATPDLSGGGNGGSAGVRGSNRGEEGAGPAVAGGGGGGGGGAAGRIRIRSIDADPVVDGAVISPAPTLN